MNSFRGVVLRVYNSLYDVGSELDAQVVVCSLRKTLGSVLVGDRVEVIHEGDRGSIEAIEPRKNEIAQPHIANVDQLFLMVSAKDPRYDLAYIDTMLIAYENLPVTIILNKIDLLTTQDSRHLADYESLGYKVKRLSVRGLTTQTKQELFDEIAHRVTLFVGLSGVGKSSLLKALTGQENILTSEVSRKLGRGRQTTKQSRAIFIPEYQALVIDSPGFSMVTPNQLNEDRVSAHYKDVLELQNLCRFGNCRHLREPDCAIKEAVLAGKVSSRRYETYVKLIQQMDQKQSLRYE